ncbi:hypothetical protein HOF78_01325 [Candidatus Woesearchaeota archaeon]|jgi:hypothetical protein|nr:hypothetical protein [Candidatus Woesearchaeota archaeon]MBT6044975.1 hypothetical protein [Candidatus Woesearchaeota archaeon]
MGMLKRGVIGIVFLFILLFSLGIVNAEIIVNGPDQAKVNIGDEIGITGYVLRADDVLGLLRFELKCAESSDVLMVRSVSLNAGVKKDFSDEFAILSANEGDCRVEVSLESLGDVLESKTSTNFEVTSALTGTFKIDKEGIQAGESIHVSGNVFKQGGDAVEGFAIISLKKDGDIYFSDSVDIKKGALKYDVDTTDVPGGEYTVEVDARNNFGNLVIANAGVFTLISEIEVNAHSAKVHYLPKEKVKITGTASVLGGKLKSGIVYITMGENKYDTKVKSGNFDFDFLLLNVIESGKHDIEVRVEDESGNFGIHSFSIIVDPIPTKIVIVADKEAINPGEKISIRAFLRDQASIDIDESITLKVVNDKNEEYYDSVKNTGEEAIVTLAEDVVPGNYFIRGTFGDIEGEKIFVVGEVELLNYDLDGQLLVVTNVGNIPYEGPLQIEMSSSTKTSSISRKLNLGVGQEERIDLGIDRVTGEYDIIVNDNVFDDVQVVGVEKNNYLLWIAYVILGLVILYLLFNLLKKIKGRRKVRFHTRPITPVVRRPEPKINHMEIKKKIEMKNEVVEKIEPKVLKEEPKRKHVKRGLFSRFKKQKDEEPLNIQNVFSGVDKGWVRDNDVKVHDYKEAGDLASEPKKVKDLAKETRSPE